MAWGRTRYDLDRITQQLQGISKTVERLDAALIVRDPGSARSVEAYDGLRRQVAMAAQERRVHLVQLSEIAERVAAGTSAQDLQSLTQEWCMQANLVALNTPEPLEAFDLVDGADSQGLFEVLRPAWIDASTGAVVRRGLAQAVAADPDAMLRPPPSDELASEEVEELPPTEEANTSQVEEELDPDAVDLEPEDSLQNTGSGRSLPTPEKSRKKC